MSHVQWARARFGTSAHAIIDGDVMTLCGKFSEQHTVEVKVNTDEARQILHGLACPDCAAIITEAASVLEVADHV